MHGVKDGVPSPERGRFVVVEEWIEVDVDLPDGVVRRVSVVVEHPVQSRIQSLIIPVLISV